MKMLTVLLLLAALLLSTVSCGDAPPPRSTALFLTAGESTAMAQLYGGKYTHVNRPSDKFDDGSFRSPRTVFNTVILSFSPKKRLMS